MPEKKRVEKKKKDDLRKAAVGTVTLTSMFSRSELLFFILFICSPFSKTRDLVQQPYFPGKLVHRALMSLPSIRSPQNCFYEFLQLLEIQESHFYFIKVKIKIINTNTETLCTPVCMCFQAHLLLIIPFINIKRCIFKLFV